MRACVHRGSLYVDGSEREGACAHPVRAPHPGKFVWAIASSALDLRAPTAHPWPTHNARDHARADTIHDTIQVASSRVVTMRRNHPAAARGVGERAARTTTATTTYCRSDFFIARCHPASDFTPRTRDGVVAAARLPRLLAPCGRLTAMGALELNPVCLAFTCRSWSQHA
jgi:hypothetical protein